MERQLVVYDGCECADRDLAASTEIDEHLPLGLQRGRGERITDCRDAIHGVDIILAGFDRDDSLTGSRKTERWFERRGDSVAVP